ncbi:MAG: cytochrome C peroxidase [Gammaproteobacteria bacterium]|nr:cytochrome C peroxidase [Gammaproteobacteria bacterium]
MANTYKDNPRSLKTLLGCILIIATIGCDEFDPAPVTFTQADIVSMGAVQTLEIRERVLTSLPESAPEVNTQQASLGRLLFWDPILSGNRDVACATCHLPEFGYTDNQHQSIGVGGTGRGEQRVEGHTGRVPRNSQTVLNTVWNGIDELGNVDANSAPMFWDNRVQTLEAQAIEPIRSREEMRGDNFAQNAIDSEISARLNANAEYQLLFSEAFGVQTITATEITQALASFQKTLVANDSPFDRWMRGESDAMTDRQVSGMQEFVIAGCADCHNGPLFSDFEPHVLGVHEGADVLEPDEGDGTFAFRTPTLRQLAFTAPYFHAGQFSTLGDAIEFYDGPGNSTNPNVPTSELDEEFLEIPEMDDGRGAIIQDFLDALNDDTFDQEIPSTVPSGLPVGGFE